MKSLLVIVALCAAPAGALAQSYPACEAALPRAPVGALAGYVRQHHRLHQPNGTNLLLWSEQFDRTTWSKQGNGAAAPTVTADAAVAPDGTTTAEQIVFPAVSGAGSFSFVVQDPGTSYSGSTTFSVWLRTASGTSTLYVFLTPDGVNYHNAACALTTTWQRCWVTSVPGGSDWNYAIGVDLRDTGQSSKSAQTIYAWGGDLEQAAAPGPYTRSTSALAINQPSTYPILP